MRAAWIAAVVFLVCSLAPPASALPAVQRVGPLTYVTVTNRAPAQTLKALSANCPRGEWVAGGGIKIGGGFAGAATVGTSTPSDNHRGWTGWVQNEGTSEQIARTTAVCVKNQPTYVQSASHTVPAGFVGDVQAQCPAGTTVIGGGGVISGAFGDHVDIHGSDFQQPDIWLVYANNRGGLDETLTTTVICNKMRKRYVVTNNPQPVEAGTSRTYVARCPAGTAAASGGTSDNSADIHLAYSSISAFDSRDRGAAPDDGWRNVVRNGSSGEVFVTPDAICVKT